MPPFDRAALQVYLNDHLAGSVGAFQLMDRLCSAHADSRLGDLLDGLRYEVKEEQTILQNLLASIGGTESTVAKTIAWVGEKVSRFKIGPGGHDSSGLMLFEALEALSLGFWGRRSLWWTLAQLAREAPIESSVDFTGLATRAELHLDELESLRMDAAMTALLEAAGTATVFADDFAAEES